MTVGHPALACSLLGPFELRCDGVPVVLPLGAQRVLALLAFTERPLLRRYVGELLWPETTGDRAAGNLRSALWRLRQPGLELIHCTGPQLGLAPGLDVDLHRVRGQITRLLEAGAEPQEGDEEVQPLTTDILTGWYDDWVLLERERHLQRRLHALEALSERLIAAGRLPAAVDAAHAAVVGEPLRETAHLALVRAHLAEGNRCAAVHQYQAYRELLRASLGLEPSEALSSLVAGIVRGSGTSQPTGRPASTGR
jgi:DNA-binding SARP family transcriptional activator